MLRVDWTSCMGAAAGSSDSTTSGPAEGPMQAAMIMPTTIARIMPVLLILFMLFIPFSLWWLCEDVNTVGLACRPRAIRQMET